MRIYTPSDWYWIVGGDNTKVYSSARAAYFPIDDSIFLAWLDVKNDKVPTNIDTEANLWLVLSQQYPDGINISNSIGQNTYKTQQINKLDKVQFQVLFNHENRIRILTGQPQITALQFINGVKALI